MRSAWNRLNRWPDGWWALAVVVVLGFAASAYVGVVVLDHDPDYALPMAAAAAVGCGLGQLIRMCWPKRTKAPAWPVHAAPPRRPD